MKELGARADPFRAYNFVIRLVESSGGSASTSVAPDRGALGGFSECSGLEMTLQLEEYRAGGRNDTVLRFPTRVSWTNLRLRRGVALSDDLWEWHYSFVLGKGRRRDGLIFLLDELRQPAKTWRFTRGLPVKWTGPALDAAQGRVAIEELEIGHEGLELVAGVGAA